MYRPRTSTLITTVLLAIVTRVLAAGTDPDPMPARSRITSVGLFKNGLAVVRRELTIPADGVYEITDVPEPVHGTFWIECNATIETRMAIREYEAPLRVRESTDLQEHLAGRMVTIQFRDPGRQPITGRVVDSHAEARDVDWDRSYAPSAPEWSYWSAYAPSTTGTANAPARFLVLESASGLDYVDSSAISSLHVDQAGTSVRVRRPALLITARGIGAQPATAVISYLAKGLAWAPSYRVDMTHPSTLKIAQEAVIKNELEDLRDVQVDLISGFPSIEFADVLSPLSLETTLQDFFSQLSQLNQRGQRSDGIISQQMVTSNSVSASDGWPEQSIIPGGEGVDVHYHPIGSRTLLEGESLMLGVASDQVAYERVVEWTVPDSRDAYGRPIGDWSRIPNVEDTWDAVQFRNPFDFPMTTAPAIMIANGRFNGQRTSHWVNPGELTTLQITPALSVRTHAAENEVPGEREITDLGGQRFRRTTANGQLAVGNHRNEAIKIVIRRQFSGELIEADEEPRRELREEGVYSINPRQELTWTLTLQPGEEKVLEYSYTVLVYF